MNRWNLRKIIAFLLIVVLVFGTSANEHFVRFGITNMVSADYNGEPIYVATIGDTEYKIVKFLSSGTFIVPADVTIADVTVVGGGGYGGFGGPAYEYGGGGGGGGYVVNRYNVAVEPGTSIPITVGGSGGISRFNNTQIIANPGQDGFCGSKNDEPKNYSKGGNGGSGGSKGQRDGSGSAAPGGSDGSDGGGYHGYGIGQHTTTRGVDDALYGGGGGGGDDSRDGYGGAGGAGGGGSGGAQDHDSGWPGTPNTGGGGGGGTISHGYGAPGGSGIVIIRWIANNDPVVDITTPSQNKVFGLKDTAVVSIISVSDPDNNALTCKYYIDGIEKETKSVAGNTTTPQTVNFSAINVDSLTEGSHTMKFTVNDGLDEAEKSINFTIDKTSPKISNLTATSTEISMTITGSSTDTVAGMDPLPYNYTVTDGTSTYTSGWKAETTYTQTSLQPNRNYTVKLEARDKVGNISEKSITAYTKAQAPTITTGNLTTTTMDITVSDSNPANTQYQIAAGTKYISSSGALTATAQWITLINKKIKATGMTPNTTYGLKVKAKNGINEETSVSATVNKTTMSTAPESVIAHPDKCFITLTWSAMPNIIRYEVSADGAIKDAGTQAAYTHEGLTPNTQHSYKVRVVNAGGAGDWSSTQTLSTLPDPPGIPTNLRGEAAQAEIILAWDAVEGAASYDVEADGKLKENILTTTYTHADLIPNTPHTYRVRAENRGGEGAWSDLLNKDTLPEPPGIPEGLQIKEITKETIVLTWNSTERAEGYDIEADGAIIDSTTETTYTHTGLTADTEYIYKIRARNKGGESGWTAEAAARTLPEKPSIPNNLTATAGAKEITISWDSAERAAEYDIEADGVSITTITGTSYIHEGLTPDTKHTYRIKARNTGGESDYSTMVTAYTLTETTGMALTNVAAVVTNTGITLMWDAVAADTEYDVEADGEIKDNGRNTTYIHSGLQPVTSHTYKIRPKRGEEAGPWCAVLAISTLPNPPDAPGNIKAIVTNTAIQLMWDAEEGATGYDIEIDGIKVESTAGTEYIHKELVPGTEHSYRIRAVNIAGATPWSEAIVKSTIKPTYMIEAEAGKEYHIALTAMGIQEFSGRKLVLKYNPEEVEIADLCEETRAIELESGRIPGTSIKLNHTEGRIELEADRMIAAGKAWTGVMDTILIRSRVDGQISLDYLVE